MSLHRTSDTTRAKRARDLGVPFDGTPGPHNGITDVPGVEVGLTTLVAGDGELVPGRGPVRTGVTVILPRGKSGRDPVFAGRFALNGNGEMTGTAWVDESGFLEGPVAITNTHGVGAVHEAVIRWQLGRGAGDAAVQPWALPVVSETWDGYLNDINGFHVKADHVFAALDGATGGPVAEGNTGGGTGMVAHQFKGGTGTASRVVSIPLAGGQSYVVGALVQANYGTRAGLMIAGVPVGREIADLMPEIRTPALAPSHEPSETGSIVVVIATDAPLLPHQLRRVATRCSLGVARNGGTGGHFSGDLFLAFSTANPGAARAPAGTVNVPLDMLPNDRIDPIFRATIEATEEAIVNAMVAAETMTGIDGNTVHALPHDRLREILRKYGRSG